MKTNTILVSSLAVFFALSTACNSESGNQTATEQHGDHTHETAVTEEGNPQFKDETSNAVYQHYIHVKTALVKSDAAEAKAGAKALQEALTNAANQKGADLASKIASASDIKQQRDAFDELTAEVENFIKSTGLKSGKIYKQYCPMAKDGEGAYWLASETQIRNPYYGDEMLECGEVKEEIK